MWTSSKGKLWGFAEATPGNRNVTQVGTSQAYKETVIIYSSLQREPLISTSAQQLMGPHPVSRWSEPRVLGRDSKMSHLKGFKPCAGHSKGELIPQQKPC